ncbi:MULTISPECIES: KTSC domain-containing protein [unclassified Bradyrhizobium]|uniref:KTSC domain-containing protein n=1 Tax=unclassified Bradyrhizobium TaxID=2631580 RepID=UPI0003F83924|nr:MULTISPECIES: KTSC domain-containing protein [unclassified Bradyrhizobium]MCP3466115.1 KTSC domain-containing protein [Bradyrhizobium sp. CCGUVB23]
MVRTIAILLSQLMAAPIVSETVEIRGCGRVDLAAFACRDISRSTVLQRVCYDVSENDLIVAVNGTYDRYCSVPADTVAALMGAPSMGQFFNRTIRRPASGERYDCPTQKPVK